MLLLACTRGSSKNEVEQQHSIHLDYIRSQPYGTLLIEVDRVGNIQPHESIVTHVQSNLEAMLGKTVQIELDEVLDSPEQDQSWTIAELDTLHANHFSMEVDAQTIKMHTLLVEGQFTEETDNGYRKLGHAWAQNRLVIFGQTMLTLCDSLALDSNINRTLLCRMAIAEVWTHEIGHLLGLVDSGLPMVSAHRDTDHGNHDMDPNCVMYWTTEGEVLLERLEERLQAGEAENLWFCDACQADIEAAKE